MTLYLTPKSMASITSVPSQQAVLKLYSKHPNHYFVTIVIAGEQQEIPCGLTLDDVHNKLKALSAQASRLNPIAVLSLYHISSNPVKTMVSVPIIKNGQITIKK